MQQSEPTGMCHTQGIRVLCSQKCVVFLPKGNGKTAAISIASLLEDYCDHFIAYWKVCKHLGLKVGTSENGGSNMLKRMNIDNPTQQQKEEAENKAIEEHHTILFILGANKYKYGKLIEDMKMIS